MRHADAELQLWLANHRIAREQHEAELARLAGHGSETPSLRRRAGRAVIALGERLSGDATHLHDTRRVAARAT